jgi:membrane fusion protein, heavy metal efflux system
VIGDSVHKGQILAYVVPAVGVVDRSQLRREVAQLTTAIRVETENLEILKQFSFVPFRDGKIYQSEQRLAGLRREREALLPMLKVRESLIASTDGVISTSAAVPGRITHPGEMVFDIVNPKQLWIEASAPDPVTAEAASHVAAASALTPEGQVLAVSFVGSGLAVQQQSTPLLFRIENPPDGLRVGRPVTVSVQSGKQSTRGILLRRDAITVGSDGVQEVWEQIEPEVFLPHPVRTRTHDGQTVMVLDGLSDGAHVVIRGVNLMAQLQ